VFCPHCGRTLTESGGKFFCYPGQACFAGELAAAFRQRFPAQRPADPEFEAGCQPDRWFCPGCGVPHREGLACLDCGGSIEDLRARLMELAPHRDEDGSWAWRHS
jgi:hypothetical protein